MNVVGILVGIGVLALIGIATYVVVKEFRSGNHCVGCAGCSKKGCGADCSIRSKREENKKN